MKSKTHLPTTIMTILVLLGALNASVIAQEPASRQPAQQDELKLPELAVQGSNSEILPVRVPVECTRIKPIVQVHDVADAFKSPGVPPTLSPALQAFLSSRNVTPKGYDDPRVNTVFADSFRLGNCKVCYATLEVRVRHYQDAWSNDTILVGGAPFNISQRIFSSNIWQTNDPNPTTHTYVLPAGALSSYIWNSGTNPFLDVIAQDDTDFDYATLSVWYY